MDWRALLRPLGVRIDNMVARSTVTVVDDSQPMQIVQLKVGAAGEVRDDIERVQPYGLTSVPDVGALAAVVFVQGYRDHGLAVVTDDPRYRPTGLAAGEVALYHKSGTKIHLKANGDVEIIPASGNTKVTGTLTATVDVIAAGVSLKNHVHAFGGLTTTATVGAGPTLGLIAGSTAVPT